MARSVRDSTLDTRTARARLKPAGKPYYRALDPGLHIGYRKGKTGGKWVMRRYDGAYTVETIGIADDKDDADGVAVLDFFQAQQLARAKHKDAVRRAKGLPDDLGPYTVRACVDEYIVFLEAKRKSAKDARYRAEALILPK